MHRIGQKNLRKRVAESHDGIRWAEMTSRWRRAWGCRRLRGVARRLFLPSRAEKMSVLIGPANRTHEKGFTRVLLEDVVERVLVWSVDALRTSFAWGDDRRL